MWISTLSRQLFNRPAHCKETASPHSQDTLSQWIAITLKACKHKFLVQNKKVRNNALPRVVPFPSTRLVIGRVACSTRPMCVSRHKESITIRACCHDASFWHPKQSAWINKLPENKRFAGKSLRNLVNSQDDLLTASERLGHASSDTTKKFYRDNVTKVTPLSS